MGEILGLLFDGFGVALQWHNIAYMTVGVSLGTVFGCIPGLGPTNGIAILLPVTFVIPPTSAIIFLSAIYYGGCYGGAIASICLNIPGTPMAAATALDGYPMAKKRFRFRGTCCRGVGFLLRGHHRHGSFYLFCPASG